MSFDFYVITKIYITYKEDNSSKEIELDREKGYYNENNSHYIHKILYEDGIWTLNNISDYYNSLIKNMNNVKKIELFIIEEKK